jgi:hypothetical protein
MLSPTDTLKVECGTCGHRATWRRSEAFDRLGPDVMPCDVRERLRCSVCSERSNLRVWI